MRDTFTQFEAVVLAGGLGNRMTVLTNDVNKSLLPIANVPMFWYPLHALAQNRFRKVLVIAGDDNVDQIREFLSSRRLPSLGELEVEVVAPSDPDGDLGTADVLRAFANKITQDFVLVGGDFISDINLRNMIQFHNSNRSVLTALTSNQVAKGIAPGPKEMQKYRDFMATCGKTNQLLMLQPEEDMDSDRIEIDTQLYNQFRDVALTSNYLDCHVYIMDKRLLNVITWDREISSVKADLIPLLIDKQFNKGDAVTQLFQSDKLVEHAHELQYGVDRELPSPFRLFAYQSTRDTCTVIGRANTLGSYIECNRAVLDQNPPFVPELQAPVLTGAKVYVVKSVVGENCEVGSENISIVKSSVGNGCSVEKNTKITDSIVMEGVKIGEGCKIIKSIICEGVEIGKNCIIDNSIVASGQTIESKTTVKFDIIRTEVEMNIEDY